MLYAIIIYMKNIEETKLSIVVTAHNEGLYLYKTILSIEKSIELLPEISYEIIISLDNPDDETIRVAKFLSKKKQIKIFESSFGNPADNRNFAISKAKGSICALIDGDDLVSKNWFKNGLAKLKENENSIIRPQIHAMFGTRMNSLSIWQMRNSTEKNIDSIQMSYWNPWTLTLIAKTELLKDTPFKPQKGGFGFEDYLFNCDIISKNIPILIAPETTFFYRQRPNVSVSTQHKNTILDYSDLFDIEYIKSIEMPIPQKKTSSRINIKKYYRALYDIAKKSENIRRAMSPVASRILSKKNMKKLPTFFIEDWREINAIENQLYPTKEKISQVEFHPLTFNPLDNEYGIVYKKLCEQISGNNIDYLFLAPAMSGRGGTEKLISNYIRALKEIHPKWNIGILSTQPFNKPTIDFFINLGVDLIDFGRLTKKMGDYEKNIIWSRLLIQAKIKNLHLINDEYWYRWLSEHKSVIKEKNIKLNISLFMREFTSQKDRILSFADPQLVEVWDIVNLVFTDNQAVIDQALENNLFEKSKFRVHYQPQTIEEDNNSNNIEYGQKIKILWASRIALQKRPDILKKISKELSKDFEIDAYGVIEKKQYSKKYFKDSRVNYMGGFKGINSIETSNYDIYLYTSQTDGVPNILLEVASKGIPIVSSNIGGISEFITDKESGLLVDMEDIDGYVKAIEFLKNNPTYAEKFTANLRKKLKTQHSWKSFIDKISKDI